MAAFICPECQSADLSIDHSITLPPDNRSDDIILQTLRCRRCEFRGVAIYEESRRGSLDSESWDHRGYRLEPEVLAELNRMIRACPTRKDKRCSCPSHRTLGTTTELGRWRPPFETNWERSFPMQRS